MLPPLIQALLTDPACYDHPVAKLELVETHISWVVLTGFFAYKIKKPVNLDFLDFSTLAMREQDCHDELRLNLRLAADYYLDVVAIAGKPDAPRINGSGEILEYAVKMRQFPVDVTLDRLAGRGELNELHIDALAARLARFHLTECERATADSPWGEPALIARPVEENFQVLARCANDLDGLRRWCDAEHARLAPLMRVRKENRFVRECHGDLHLANLAWSDGRLIIFDALEFSPALRWIDVISEVAFCYMDLLNRKYAPLAARFLNAWLEATGDYQGVALLSYYSVYRALVRAKVAALRVEQGCASSAAEMNECLQLAKQLASILSSASPSFSSPFPLVPSPSLWITHGFSGSGKTTISQQQLEKQGLIRLRSDVERKRLAGLDASARSGGQIGTGLYSPQNSLLTYEHLANLAEGLLMAGWPVIVDAAFLYKNQRDMFCELARRCGARFQILDIQVDPAVLRERVSRRSAEGRDASEADLQVLQQQIEMAEPLDETELRVTERL
jgi:aminoglycoside phosphotransferase family enzyme/predicted kinase